MKIFKPIHFLCIISYTLFLLLIGCSNAQSPSEKQNNSSYDSEERGKIFNETVVDLPKEVSLDVHKEIKVSSIDQEKAKEETKVPSPAKKTSGLNWEEFLLGAMGALLTIYLRKQEIIPEFRPLFDTFAIEREAVELQDRIKIIQNKIDGAQDQLGKNPQAENQITEHHKIEIESLHKGLEEERARLRIIERKIIWSQVVSRSLGFLFYIGLGGVFGTLLAGKVKIEGLSENFSSYIQSLIIGASWIAYLSTIGLRIDRERIIERTTEVARKEFTKRTDEILKDIMPKVSKIVKETETADRVPEPTKYKDVMEMIDKAIEQIKIYQLPQQIIKKI